MKLINLIPLLFFSFSLQSFAQSINDWIFSDASLPEIHISIDSTHLSNILENVHSDEEYPAEFIFLRNNIADTVSNIGFRIRGNTSRNSQKKSFKISFDTFVDGREYYGLDKLNINGEHNDPSIIRSKLSWDIFKVMNVPSPRSNHVKLYINQEYYGLYINVEHIDNEFVEDRFGSDTGNLYKALYPADLTYLGDDPENYKAMSGGRSIYELKTNEHLNDYSDLASFIIFMHKSSDSEFKAKIRDYINVDGVLRVLAVDILTGMWDNYTFNKNNFYLYNNPITSRFEFIPYDYDNTFGIDWFGISWDTRDINNWGTNESRPLIDRLLHIPEYQNRFNYYVEKLLDEYFNSSSIDADINRLKAMIQEAAEQDIYRTLDYGYTIDDFNNSYDSALDGHVKNGVKEYVINRHNSARTQLLNVDIAPVILRSDTKLSYSNEGAYVIITAHAFDDGDLTMIAHIEHSEQRVVEMLDNGESGDEVSSDGIYTAVATLEDGDQSVRIFIEATDDKNQSDRFPYNPSDYLEIEIPNRSENLVINEFMASNNSTIQDEFGAFEDWVEIYNPTSIPVVLSGYYLTDDLENPKKWAFPDTTIPSQDFLLVWTDDDDEEGSLHTSFKLSKSGEELGLFFDDGNVIESIDAFTFGEQETDVSYGRAIDGGISFVSFANPTPGESNSSSTSNELIDFEHPDVLSLHQNYPNPFNPNTIIPFSLTEQSSITLNIYSIHGALIQTLVKGTFNAGYHSVTFDAGSLASGIYFYRLESEKGAMITQKMTLLK